MKLTTLLLIISLVQVSAATLGQQVTLHQKNTPLAQVLKQIGKQSGYGIYYDAKAIPAGEKIDIAIDHADIRQAIETALSNFDLSYEINGQIITISKKQASPFIEKIKDILAAIDARGTVIDEQGRPVPGATVKLKNGKVTTITDEKGRFTIPNCNTGDLLIITFIGYNAKEVPAAADMGTIKLDVATSQLDQVVVRAYGETSQRLSVGNISSINSKQIENKPVTNALLALQGEIPGIYITQTSGFANSGVSVQIQGPNSIAYGNFPLYIVDGVPYQGQMLPNSLNGIGGKSTTGVAGNSFGGQEGNPFNMLNPQDIESISILKDADATAIYGSRAANGAVIITTKKGKAGASRVTLNLQQGIAQNPKLLEMMDTKQYLAFRKYAYFNADGLTVNSPEYVSQYDINGVWDTTRYTNWQKLLLGGTARYTNLQGSISGGSTLDQYLISGSYNRQTVIFPMPDLADQKGSFHVSLNHASANQKFHAQFSTEYMLDVDRKPGSDITLAAYTLAPNAPALFNSDGTLNWQTDASGNSTWTNPLAYEKNYSESTINNLVSSLSLSYEIAKSLKLTSLFAYTSMIQNEKLTYPSTWFPPEQSIYGGYSFISNGSNKSWSIEPQLTYSIPISRGKLDALLGGTFQGSALDQSQVYGSGYNSDLLLQNLGAAGSIYGQTTSSQYRYLANYARVGYNWADKYLLALNARRDGSSRFGDKNKFHSFWSIGGGWIFSEEHIVKHNLPWLSFGKFHLSYGTTGNDNIGDYTYLNTYTPYYGSGQSLYQGLSGLIPNGISNPNLQWELTHKLSGGIDLGFLNDRIVLSTNYYRNSSSNQLLSSALPIITGSGRLTINLPATVQNTGLEASVNATIIKGEKFSWKSNFNISINRNKLVSFPGLATSTFANQLVVNQPIDIYKAYSFAGIDAQTGFYQFNTPNGTLTSNPGALDNTALISFLPKYSGGWRNELTYKNFQLSFLFQFTKHVVSNTSLQYGYPYPGQFNTNEPARLTNYWKNPGERTIVQQISSTYSNATLRSAAGAIYSSNAVLVDGSFVRLKNVSLSYNLPKTWLQKIGMQDCRIFSDAQNLLTLTGYKGLDPENGNDVTVTLPPLRTITIGIQAGF